MREGPMTKRQLREELAKSEARTKDKCVTYKDDDGCEVTVTPGGHVFFNVIDWW